MEIKYRKCIIKTTFPENEELTVDNFNKHNMRLFDLNGDYIITIRKEEVNFRVMELLLSRNEEQFIEGLEAVKRNREYFTGILSETIKQISK